MARFVRENNSGGHRNFGKSRSSYDPKPMHKATCANCGKMCEVPFKPNGSRPVLCRDCFQTTKGDSPRRSESRNFGSSRGDDRQMFDAVCVKCGNDCQIPFRPSQGRDVFCSNCFEKSEGTEARRPDRKSFDKSNFGRDDSRNSTPNYSAQFEALNAKMDKILQLLVPAPNEIVPLESEIAEAAIEEILEEVQEEQTEIAVKKPRKTKAAIKSKTKKTASPKKK